MPTLEFKGKPHIYAHHLTVPYRSLVVDESKSAPADDGSNVLSEDAQVGVRQSVSPSVRQSVSPSVRQSVSPSVRQSVSPSVRQSVSPSVRDVRTENLANVNSDDNLIIHGDNLHALKALLPRYASRVKCIYIDPPYNTGSQAWVYNDRVNSPLMQEWLNANSPVDNEDLERHDKWLCMMWPRLHLLRELLSEDGVIFVSIDDQ